MRFLLAILHARLAMSLSLRHYRRFEAAVEAGDYRAADWHIAKGRKSNARVKRLLERVERLRPGTFPELAAEPHPPAEQAVRL